MNPRNIQAIMVIAWLASSPAGCGVVRSDAAVSAAMDATYSRFTAAYLVGEPDSVAVLFTDAPLYLPGSGGILAGVESLRAQFGFLGQLRALGRTPRIRFESIERGVSGDLAYDVGYYHLEIELEDGSRMPPTRGKYATIWRRGPDGVWRIHVDSFSPAPVDP